MDSFDIETTVVSATSRMLSARWTIDSDEFAFGFDDTIYIQDENHFKDCKDLFEIE